MSFLDAAQCAALAATTWFQAGQNGVPALENILAAGADEVPALVVLENLVPGALTLHQADTVVNDTETSFILQNATDNVELGNITSGEFSQSSGSQTVNLPGTMQDAVWI